MKEFCNKCKGRTNHRVINDYKREYTPDKNPDMHIDFAQGTWQIIECLGCEEVSLCERWITSEDIDLNTGEAEETVRIYPERQIDNITSQTFSMLPRTLRNIYREIVDTFNQKWYLSCAACLRVIIEAICSNVGIKDGNIQSKINELHIKGFLTERHASVLHEHRFLGNKALHEVQIPTKDELLIAIRIVEHTLENIYELEDKLQEMQFLRKRRTTKKE